MVEQNGKGSERTARTPGEAGKGKNGEVTRRERMGEMDGWSQ